MLSVSDLILDPACCQSCDVPHLPADHDHLTAYVYHLTLSVPYLGSWPRQHQMKLQMELCCRRPTNIRAQLIANSVQHGFGVWFTMILLLLAVNRITIIEYRHYLWRETYGRTPMAVSHWSLHTRICVCTATAVIDIHVMKHLPITHCNKPIASAYKLIVNNTFDIKLDIYIYIILSILRTKSYSHYSFHIKRLFTCSTHDHCYVHLLSLY